MRAGALGISVAADYQAEALMADEIGFPLLLDPDKNFKSSALGIDNIKVGTLFSPVTAKRYLKYRGVTKQGKPTAGPTEPPGVAIIDPDGVVQYIHRGETIGHYPPMEDVLAKLREVTGS